MQIFNSKKKDTMVLEVRGRLDALTAANLEEECGAWHSRVQIHLAGLHQL